MGRESIEHRTTYKQTSERNHDHEKERLIRYRLAGKQRQPQFLDPPGHGIQGQESPGSFREQFDGVDDWRQEKPEHQSSGQQLFYVAHKDLHCGQKKPKAKREYIQHCQNHQNIRHREPLNVGGQTLNRQENNNKTNGMQHKHGADAGIDQKMAGYGNLGNQRGVLLNRGCRSLQPFGKRKPGPERNSQPGPERQLEALWHTRSEDHPKNERIDPKQQEWSHNQPDPAGRRSNESRSDLALKQLPEDTAFSDHQLTNPVGQRVIVSLIYSLV